ncbi:MAG: hypothetical protein ACLFS1_09695 [Opitutales bacterium]
MSDTLTARYQKRSPQTDSRRKKGLWVSLLQALLVLVLLLASARFVTVLVLSFKEEPDFSAPKTIYLPQRQLEHQMAVSEFQNAAATPATVPELTTESLLANAPALPNLPDVDFTPVENEALVSESDALFGQSGLMGALGALSSQASSVSFLGITEEASRFVIIVDTSVTVVNAVTAAGSSMEAIRDEAIRLVESLNANTLFGFIQHSRNYDPFQPSLIPATLANKELALDWLKSDFRTDGSGRGWTSGPPVRGDRNGILTILNFAFDMQPDVIFLISDGGYFATTTDGGQRPVPLNDVLRLIRERQKDLTGDARIHTVHFPDPRGIDDARIGNGMRNIATRNGGKYRKISK